MTDRNQCKSRALWAIFIVLHKAMTGLSGAALQAHKDAVLTGLGQQLALNPDVQPETAPVLRFLPEALAAAPPHLVREAILPFMPDLHWQTCTGRPIIIIADILPTVFFDTEAFAEIIGPNGKLRTNAFRFGLLLLSPQLDYPDHNHETSEWYHVLSGTGLWRQGSDDFSPRAPHSAIFHNSWEVHAMRCSQASCIGAVVMGRQDGQRSCTCIKFTPQKRGKNSLQVTQRQTCNYQNCAVGWRPAIDLLYRLVIA